MCRIKTYRMETLARETGFFPLVNADPDGKLMLISIFDEMGYRIASIDANGIGMVAFSIRSLTFGETFCFKSGKSAFLKVDWDTITFLGDFNNKWNALLLVVMVSLGYDVIVCHSTKQLAICA